MPFKIKNNCIYFRNYDMTDYMDIKEINVNIETNEAFVVAEFKADIDFKTSGFLACMVKDMSEENLIDLIVHCRDALKGK